MAEPGQLARYWSLRLERALLRATRIKPLETSPVEFRVACGNDLEMVFHVIPRGHDVIVQEGHTPPEIRSTLVWCHEEDLTTGHNWRFFGDPSAVEILMQTARTPVQENSWLSVRLPKPK